ncbi:MAG: hypothetical protein EX271_08270 [Acidimicrobiales bacterium]|nr:MAG: hypothetical protein EX271_08270 [Acidimicrobiales bacterium]
MKIEFQLMFVAALLTTMVSCGGGGNSSTVVNQPPVADNIPPRVQFPLAENFLEGSEGIAFSFTSTDGNRDQRVHTISGPDADFFSLSAPRYDGTRADLDLVVNLVQDFENPSDANGDGIYDVTVTVDDGQATHSIDSQLTLADRSIAIGQQITSTSGLVAPMQIVGFQNSREIILEKAGRVVLEDENGFPTMASTTMLDLRSQITSEGERGLLGGALSPDFDTDRTIYLCFTNLDGDIEIRSYSLFADQDDMFDPATQKSIITINRPRANHNAGWIGFAPDGTLWIPTGDSGGANDPDNLAQDPFALQGKVLRIDVTGDDYSSNISKNYAIPSDNPFADGSEGAPEVFALGLRNPFRGAVEPFTGELYLGDVGQNRREEINRLSLSEPGVNFGWPLFEGLLPNTGTDSTGLTPPVLEYAHTGDRRSIIVGDFSYWETDVARESHLIFSDFYSGEIWLLQTTLLMPDQTINLDDIEGLPQNWVTLLASYSGAGLTSYIRSGVFSATQISGEVSYFEPPLPL